MTSSLAPALTVRADSAPLSATNPLRTLPALHSALDGADSLDHVVQVERAGEALTMLARIARVSRDQMNDVAELRIRMAHKAGTLLRQKSRATAVEQANLLAER